MFVTDVSPAPNFLAFMKLVDLLILSLAVAFLIIGIHQIMTVGFASAYFVIMLALVMFFLYSLRKRKTK
jgi:hypothetical protein